jgi:hypothetical protein
VNLKGNIKFQNALPLQEAYQIRKGMTPWKDA